MLENGKDFHVFHMGKTKKRNIRRAKSGNGGLMRDVSDALAEANEQLGPDHKKHLVPVIVTYKRKKKKRWASWGLN